MKYPATKIVIVTAVGSLRNPTPTGLTGCFDTTPLELGCSTKQSRFRRSGSTSNPKELSK